jgi:tetratricopeptide (TPR) repeat protein
MISRLVIVALCILLCSVVTGRAWAFSPSPSAEQSQKWKSLEHQAHVAYYNGKDTLTLLLDKQLLQLSPKNPRVLTDLGNVENDLSNFTGGIAFYKQALDVSPHHIGALLGMGESLEKLGNRSAAVEYYKQAVSTPLPSDQTSSSWLLGERANAFTHIGNYSQALMIANKIFKQNATNIDGLNSKGFALLSLQNENKSNKTTATDALDIFNTLQHHIVAPAWVLDNKAEALIQLGNYTGAISTADASITLDPKDTYAWYDRVVAFLRLDLYSKPNTPHSQTLVFKDIDAMLQI